LPARRPKNDVAASFAPRRGRPTAAQTEAISRTILSAATSLFLEKGFEGTAMDAVAARAGVPKSTLYNRFAEKKALLRAVIEARVADWSSAAAEKNWMLTDDLGQRLEQYCSSVLCWASSPEVRAFADLAANAWTSPEEKAQRSDIIGFNTMLGLIERDIRTFSPRAGITPRDPARVAAALMALLAGWLQFNLSPDPIGETEAADVARNIVALLLHGSAAW
jgi:AcrR family transcriptional regulator